MPKSQVRDGSAGGCVGRPRADRLRTSGPDRDRVPPCFLAIMGGNRRRIPVRRVLQWAVDVRGEKIADPPTAFWPAGVDTP